MYHSGYTYPAIILQLGLTNEGESPDVVKEKGFTLLEGSGIAPVDLHSMLWNWSRNGFEPEV